MAAKKTTKKDGSKVAATEKGARRKSFKESLQDIQTPAAVVPVIGPEISSDRRRKLSTWMEKTNQAAKGKVVIAAEEAPNAFMIRRPTGIATLDRDLGGGWAAGGLSIISGPDNAGKSYLELITLAANQRIFGHNSTTGHALVESGGFDFIRAKQVGFRVALPPKMISDWRRGRTSSGLPDLTPEELAWCNDQVGTFTLFRGRSGEELLQVVLSANETGLYQIIGIDSLSALMPSADQNKDLDDANAMGARAVLQTDFVRHYTAQSNGIQDTNYTTILGIAQVRANQKAGPYGREWKAEGAYAIKHAKLTDLTVFSGERLRRDINGVTTIVGKQLCWETTKGKAGTHDGIKGSVDYYHTEYLQTGVDMIGNLIEEAARIQAIQATPRGWCLPYIRNGEPVNALPDGLDDSGLRHVLSTSPPLEILVRQAALQKAGLRCLFVEEELFGLSCLASLPVS